jgi:hypothetical protein
LPATAASSKTETFFVSCLIVSAAALSFLFKSMFLFFNDFNEVQLAEIGALVLAMMNA